MQPQETLANMQEYYRRNIRPALESGDVPQALRGIVNLTLEMQFYSSELYPFHSGPDCMARSEAMQDELKKGRLPSHEIVREFEAYLAQFKLSTISGNKGH